MMKTLEEMLVDQCAPTLAGVKPANLFRCADTEDLFPAIYKWNLLLRRRGIRIRVVKRCRRTHACLIYVCDWKWICRVLSQRNTIRFLEQEGYDASQGAESILCQLSRRLCVQADFPHEIGVFLGYPLCDVIGFIQNKGQNYSCCGYWKCYGDAGEAQRKFDLYTHCTAKYRRLFRAGIPLQTIIGAA